MTFSISSLLYEDGKYDFQKQKELADKYEQIEEIKRSIAQKILTLSEIIVLQEEISKWHEKKKMDDI